MTVDSKRREKRYKDKQVSKRSAMGNIILTKTIRGREHMYHATKGWRSRAA
jgi:hypothetical protein